MRIKRYLHTLVKGTLVLCGVIVAGCGGSSRAYQDTPPDFGILGGRKMGMPSETGRGSSSRTGRLTILLAQYNQSNRAQMAQALQQRARQVLNTQDIWLQNEPLGLAVYYGHFQSNDQAKREMERVKGVYPRLQAGQWQFAFVKEIAQPDPPAPQDWNLLNSDCRYSLEIATYYDDPDKNYFKRKSDAVKAVKAFREAGVPAYFVHGQNHSRIYVGCIPASQVRESREGGRYQVEFSPEAKLLQRKYPYFYEQGAEVHVTRRNREGQAVKVKVQSQFVDVDMLKNELPY